MKLSNTCMQLSKLVRPNFKTLKLERELFGLAWWASPAAGNQPGFFIKYWPSERRKLLLSYFNKTLWINRAKITKFRPDFLILAGSPLLHPPHTIHKQMPRLAHRRVSAVTTYSLSRRVLKCAFSHCESSAG